MMDIVSVLIFIGIVLIVVAGILILVQRHVFGAMSGAPEWQCLKFSDGTLAVIQNQYGEVYGEPLHHCPDKYNLTRFFQDHGYHIVGITAWEIWMER